MPHLPEVLTLAVRLGRSDPNLNTYEVHRKLIRFYAGQIVLCAVLVGAILGLLLEA